MKNIACITIGQSPRDDILFENGSLFGNEINIIQFGALDNYDEGFIKKNFKPIGDEYRLVSKLKDGGQIEIGKSHIVELMQFKINEAQKVADLILILCTGIFLEEFISKIPIIFPYEIIYSIVPTVVKDRKTLVIVPDKAQLEESNHNWGKILKSSAVVNLSPYSKNLEINRVTNIINNSSPEFVLLDCMGYTKMIKDEIATKTKAKVILSKSLVASVVKQFI